MLHGPEAVQWSSLTKAIKPSESGLLRCLLVVACRHKARQGGVLYTWNKQQTSKRIRCGCTKAARSEQPNTPGQIPFPYFTGQELDLTFIRLCFACLQVRQAVQVLKANSSALKSRQEVLDEMALLDKVASQNGVAVQLLLRSGGRQMAVRFEQLHHRWFPAVTLKSVATPAAAAAAVGGGSKQ